MKIKSFTYIILAALLLVSCLSACGKKSEETQELNVDSPTQMLETGAAPLPPEKSESSEENPSPTPSASPSPTPSASPSPTPSASPKPTPSPTPSPTPVPGTSGAKTEYEVFMALSPTDKDAFMESFESISDFYTWLVAAQQAYADSQQEATIIEQGDVIDLGKN